MTWIEKSVPAIGMLVGMALTAVGAVLVLSSMIKIATYHPTQQSWMRDTCQTQMIWKGAEQETITRTPDEVAQCIADNAASERATYLNQKKDNAIDGGVLLVVGIIFWAIFMRWWKRAVKQ